MKYSVYVSHAINKAVLHTRDCAFNRLHGGLHSHGQGYWKDFDNIEEAISFIKSTGKKEKKACKYCLPNVKIG